MMKSSCMGGNEWLAQTDDVKFEACVTLHMSLGAGGNHGTFRVVAPMAIQNVIPRPATTPDITPCIYNCTLTSFTKYVIGEKELIIV